MDAAMTATIAPTIRITGVTAISTIATTAMIMVTTIETAMTGTVTAVATMLDGTSDRMATTSPPGATASDYQRRITGTDTWFAITAFIGCASRRAVTTGCAST